MNDGFRLKPRHKFFSVVRDQKPGESQNHAETDEDQQESLCCQTGAFLSRRRSGGRPAHSRRSNSHRKIRVACQRPRAYGEEAVANQPGNKYVTVEVAGKKLQLNAQTLQQGPLTQEQTQQIAEALRENKSTDGLVQTQHPDGTVSIDLQGRFQNVMLAKKNDDGSVSQACVDNAEAAGAFFAK